MTNEITIENVSYHRNGVTGEGFHVVTFTQQREWIDPNDPDDAVEMRDDEMFAVVFPLDEDEDGRDAFDRGEFYNCPTAVFDRGLLGEGEARFLYNSFRGDAYDHALRTAVKEWSRGWTIQFGNPDMRGRKYPV